MPFTIYGVKINSTLLGGILNIGLPTNTEARGEATSGQPSPQLVALYGQSPRPAFSTKQIARALAACGLTGFACSTGAFLTFYAQKRVNEGGLSAAADSKSVTVKKGILYPERLSWSQGGDAQLGYAAQVIWDGVNNPLVFADVAVPGSLLDDQAYALASCSIGGVTVTDIQSVELDFGLRIRVSGGDGEQWPKYASIEQCVPQLSVKTENLAVHGTIGLMKACTQANTNLVFRPRTQAGRFALSGNVTIAMAGMGHVAEPIAGSGTGNADATIVVNANDDATHPLLLIT